jgi:hypothetical protein
MLINDGPTYSVQWKRWWWPMYLTCKGPVRLDDGIAVNRSNGVFGDLDSAAEYARSHARYNTKFKPKVAGYLYV